MNQLRLSVSAVFALVLSAGAGVLFTENFGNYNYTAPNISDKVDVWMDNEVVWRRESRVQVNGGEGEFFVKPIDLPTNGKFDFDLQYQFMNAETNRLGAFEIVFRGKTGGEKRLRVEPGKIAGFEVEKTPNHSYSEIVLKASGGKADVHFSAWRAFKKIGTVDLPENAASVNIALVKGAEAKFALNDVTLRTPSALPDYSAKRQFADPRSLTQPLGKEAKTAPAGGVTLDISPATGRSVRFVTSSTNVIGKFVLAYAPDAGAEKGETREHSIRASVSSMNPPAVNPLVERHKNVKLPDGEIVFGSNFLIRHVRPNMRQYWSSYDIEPQGIDVLRDWNTLPAATRHPLDIRTAPMTDGRVGLWIDGSLVKEIGRRDAKKPESPALASVTLVLNAGVKYVETVTKAPEAAPRFVTLDLGEEPRAKAFVNAKSSIPAGRRDFGGVPMLVADPLDSQDVAICHHAKDNWGLEVDEYHGRQPLWNFPSAIHRRLPALPYAKAHILFALDPDKSKDRILTIRMGHYQVNGTGSNMLGDAALDFSALAPGEVPASCRQVGTVTKNGKEIPLYLTAVDMNPGAILDLVSGRRYDGFSCGDYIDFEFLGKLWCSFQQLDRSHQPDPASSSAFNIFGVTLETLGARVFPNQSEPANLFTSDMPAKKRVTAFDFEALRANTKLRVEWTVFDETGKELFKDDETVKLAKVGDTATVEIPLKRAQDPGWYALKVAFIDSTGARMDHDAAFAVMPPVGRQVSKWDSPYATWWFEGTHGAEGDHEKSGTVFQKTGIARVSWGRLSDEEHDRFNTTSYRCTYLAPALKRDEKTGKWVLAKPYRQEYKVTDPETGKDKWLKFVFDGPDATYEHLALLVTNTYTRAAKEYDTVMTWHETGPGCGIPDELLGKPAPKPSSDWERDRWERFAAQLDIAADAVKRVNKLTGRNLRHQIGNTSASIGAIAVPLRGGAKKESFTCVGFETPAQTVPPERLTEVGLQGMRVTQDSAEKLLGRPIEMNGAWEFTYRCERDLGERLQAEWYTRDTIICLANDFHYISPGILFDCRGCYYNTLWGASGMLRRPPFDYPKRAIVAYAALTKILDGVKFVRQIPLDETTVYAVEFKRMDGKTVTVLWTQRGEAKFTVDSPVKGQKFTMYGVESKLAKGVSTLDISGAPIYLVTEKPLASVTLAGRSFAEDSALAAKGKVVGSLVGANGAAPEVKPDPGMDNGEHHGYLSILHASDAFNVAVVTDEEKGDCVEVAIDRTKNADVSRYVTEYTTLRLAKPLPVAGQPAILGLWLKGDSNGAQIRFEIEDAKGEVFKNLTTGPCWCCDIYDWPGHSSANFAGWNFVWTPVRKTPLVYTNNPGPVSEQWVSEGGDKKIDFPIKVRAVTVGINRDKIDLLDFKPAAACVRLGEIVAVED